MVFCVLEMSCLKLSGDMLGKARSFLKIKMSGLFLLEYYL